MFRESQIMFFLPLLISHVSWLLFAEVLYCVSHGICGISFWLPAQMFFPDKEKMKEE